MNIKQKLTSAALIGAMMAGVVAPASFAAVKVRNNGAGSVNGVAKVKLTKKVVAQGNVTGASTFVMTGAKTGGNDANANTGDGTSVTTGTASTTTTVRTTGGDNTNTVAEQESCCCGGEEDTDVAITGNGAGSFNGVFVLSACKNVVKQGNATLSETTVISGASTGGNSASANTGGTTSVTTGNATTTTTVTTTGGSNTNN